jgi:hypothetical protein
VSIEERSSSTGADDVAIEAVQGSLNRIASSTSEPRTTTPMKAGPLTANGTIPDTISSR